MKSNGKCLSRYDGYWDCLSQLTMHRTMKNIIKMWEGGGARPCV